MYILNGAYSEFHKSCFKSISRISFQYEYASAVMIGLIFQGVQIEHI